MKIEVYYGTFVAPYGNDYTVRVYSKPGYEVTDEQGRTNMIHMDGQEPSGFTNSNYRGYGGAKGVDVPSPKPVQPQPGPSVDPNPSKP